MQLKAIGHKTGFDIFLDNVLVFSHSESNPMLYAGWGRLKAKMSHGCFKVRRRVYQKYVLRNFRILENLPEKIIVRFSSSDIKLDVVFELGSELKLSFVSQDSKISWLWLFMPSKPSEAVYGGG